LSAIVFPFLNFRYRRYYWFGLKIGGKRRLLGEK
jgi:hypothetical protein